MHIPSFEDFPGFEGKRHASDEHQAQHIIKKSKRRESEVQIEIQVNRLRFCDPIQTLRLGLGLGQCECLLLLQSSDSGLGLWVGISINSSGLGSDFGFGSSFRVGGMSLVNSCRHSLSWTLHCSEMETCIETSCLFAASRAKIARPA